MATAQVKVRNKYRADVSKKQRAAWMDELGALEQYAKVVAQSFDLRVKFTARNTSALKKSLRALGMGYPGEPKKRRDRMAVVRPTRPHHIAGGARHCLCVVPWGHL